MSETTTTTARISTGDLRGRRDGGVDSYLGIPYAAPPVGERRFREAAPVTPWDDVRDATKMGPTAPQNELSPASGRYLPNVILPGDDYLNLNVWAPADAVDCPVMVWIHGGSLRHGSNALDGYDGTAFARDGVVLVSINYRLSFEGFAVIEGAPLNVGYSDVVAALRWVQAEIAAFGGDPGSVTIFGESAGAVVVSNLMVGAHAGSLFHQVIIQSGMPAASTPREAPGATRALSRVLGIPATRGAFAAVPVKRMLQADRETKNHPDRRIKEAGWSAAVGGPFVERDPMAAALTDVADGVRVLAGWTSEEHTFFRLDNPVGRVVFALACAKSGAGPRVVRAYRRAYPTATRAELMVIMTIDKILRLPMNKIADGRRRRGARTWFYEFDWGSPFDGLGATHAVELPFVFDTLGSPDWTNFIGTDAPQRLADEVHAAWVRFAKTGDPGWREWDADRPTMVFGAERSEVVDRRRDAQLAAWREREGDRR